MARNRNYINGLHKIAWFSLLCTVVMAGCAGLNFKNSNSRIAARFSFLSAANAKENHCKGSTSISRMPPVHVS